MLCREVRATKMVAHFLSLGMKTANDLSVEEACRLYERIRRGAYAKPYGMSATELDRVGRQRRRAKQTHPGKRRR